MIAKQTITQRQALVWGEEKLEVLANAHVVIAGLGGLGCVVAEQLARSGIGTLTLIDYGIVDLPDLGRQVLYSLDDIGETKVLVASKRLGRLTPDLKINTIHKKIHDIDVFLSEYPTLAFADCLDNYASRFALEAQLPNGAFLVHGGVEGEIGQITTFIVDGKHRLQQIFYGLAQPTSPIPIIPQCCAIVGAYQALTVLNNVWWEAGLLSQDDFDSTLRGDMLLFDLVSASSERIKFKHLE
ncbi:HesA/MoeB/ThiF family protein [Desulfovibrio litoralis]|uniref:Molybdopterin or thiamine biosynthesis adenylyltransferase n=1 Tax=Desulfovibrio litoralis DSM 11393 TaxID=1121455 RepID=A0A1M7RYC7_9BACT|nr:ThiF family adenylyltransferase [Desulfovibrio litoralis]SHN51339.1 Molybdopterin or thiamine biosynthesis adenylyltransferase [Desulfovibrio litoralis DSM 11393]